MSKDRKRDVSSSLQVKNNAENLESSALFSPPEFTPTAQPVQRQSISNKEKKVANKGLGSSNALPENLQQNMEAMSGMDLSDVSVHKNSSKPAQLQAEAYAQGSDIHLSPGKEKHLPHEAWHVVQQKQGRVQANTSIAGQGVNDSEALESEADKMGAKANSLVVQQKPEFTLGMDSIKGGPIQMVKNPFKRYKNFRKRKNDKKLASELTSLSGSDAKSANEVFKAQTQGPIGKTGENTGFAKISPKPGELLEGKAPALGMVGGEEGTDFDKVYSDEGQFQGTSVINDPRLVARQVISSRLDRKLGTNVLASEIFSKNKGNNRTLGISGTVGGMQSAHATDETAQIVDEDYEGYKRAYNRNHSEEEQLTDTRYKDVGKSVVADIDYSDPNVQRNLSKLQMIDALTHQMDRHMGNLFIDPETGDVKGIDNDAAFPSFDGKSSHNNSQKLSNQFDTNESGELVYMQEQIDEETGENFLKMSDKDLMKILSGRIGDPEKLNKNEKEATLRRFRAIKQQIQKLKSEGKLIKKEDWGKSTYDAAMLDMPTAKESLIADKMGGSAHKNYVTRGAEAVESAKSPDFPQLELESSGQPNEDFILDPRMQKRLAFENKKWQARQKPSRQKEDVLSPVDPELMPHKLLGQSPEMGMMNSLASHPLLEKVGDGTSNTTMMEEDDSDWD